MGDLPDGQHLGEFGQVVTEWPPVGRFAEVWQRIQAALPTDQDKSDAHALLGHWIYETATLVSVRNDEVGEWVDLLTEDELGWLTEKGGDGA